MGLVGIILLIGSLAIAGFIILDTYLGTPPRPKALLVSIICIFIGIGFIVIDYKMPPKVVRAEVKTSDIEIIHDKNNSQMVKKPVILKIVRDTYPWYSLFNRNKIKLVITSE